MDNQDGPRNPDTQWNTQSGIDGSRAEAQLDPTDARSAEGATRDVVETDD